MTNVLSPYIKRLEALFPSLKTELPWTLTHNIARTLQERIASLDNDYKIFSDVAIHKSVTIDSHAQIKGPAIISENCFIGPHALVRGGVFLDRNVSIGPCCEVKSSFVFSDSALAHFNFVGDSVIGSHVNLEAGAIIANHYNERKDKTIFVRWDNKVHPIDVVKFGALVGDESKIGANAVLSPGTLLTPGTIVGRLELIEQCPDAQR